MEIRQGPTPKLSHGLPAPGLMATRMPYPVKLCLNGHEWVKQRLRQEGIGFESLDNGFRSCVSAAVREGTFFAGGGPMPKLRFW